MERAAPNLVAYHKQTMQVTGELMGAGCAAPFLLARLLEAHNPKLRALARASFEVHDTSRTGTALVSHRASPRPSRRRSSGCACDTRRAPAGAFSSAAVISGV